jgi:serine/threonine-protein kinase
LLRHERLDVVERRDQDVPVPRPRCPWWIHLCVASFLGYFSLVTFSKYYPPAGLGVRVGTAGADGLVVTGVFPGYEADGMGVQPGDRVVAINGRRLRNMWEYSALSASTSVGQERTWLFERSGAQFSVTLAARRRLFFPLLRFLPVNLGLLASLVFSLIVIYSRPEDRVARLGALLLASFACSSPPTASQFLPWPVGIAGTWRHLPVPVGALLWPACVSVFTVSAITFSFFAVFPRPVIQRARIWIAALMPATLVAALCGFYLMVVVYQPERALDLDPPRWLVIASLATVPAYHAAGVAMLVWNYRRLSDLNERRRVRVLLAGIASASVGLVFFVAPIVVMNLDFGSSPVFSFLAGPGFVMSGLLVVALPCSFAYAIIAQRLFDIRIIIRRGLQYALARRSILMLVPVLIAWLIVDLMVHAEQPLLDIIQVRGWAYGAVAGVALVAYWNRDHWMSSLDRRFFRERYDAHHILRQVVEDVRAAATLDAVAQLVVARMSAAFHSSFIALVESEPHEHAFRVVAITPGANVVLRLTRDNTLIGLVRVLGKPVDASSFQATIPSAPVDLVAPIVAGGAHQREAVLVLGPKRSEEPYDHDDRELVTSVAASLALLLGKRSREDETDDALAECPRCGACNSVNATRCAEDGAALVRVSVPRVLGGRYTIQRRLGRGGMGTVYEARDGALDRQVAIKVIRDDMIGSPDTVDRFRHEALVAASFSHPNVVTIYDFGLTDDARGYLVMERLSGATVTETLRRDGFLTPARVLHIMRGVCQAVDAAHRRQLVHRDLKPDNVFLTQDEVPKVLDFGIAKFVQSTAGTTALTATGVVIGTVAYMSPEQIRGGEPNPAWDIWALTVIAYEMLASVRPFAAANSLSWVPHWQPDMWVRLINRQPELPAALASLFERAFALNPAERPSGALVFMNSLEQAFDR